jgi:hypothetical protein
LMYSPSSLKNGDTKNISFFAPLIMSLNVAGSCVVSMKRAIVSKIMLFPELRQLHNSKEFPL